MKRSNENLSLNVVDELESFSKPNSIEDNFNPEFPPEPSFLKKARSESQVLPSLQKPKRESSQSDVEDNSARPNHLTLFFPMSLSPDMNEYTPDNSQGNVPEELSPEIVPEL